MIKQQFKRRDIISNGNDRRIVNHSFLKGDEERLLVDTFIWDFDKNMIEYCEEVSANDWYLVKR